MPIYIYIYKAAEELLIKEANTGRDLDYRRAQDDLRIFGSNQEAGSKRMHIGAWKVSRIGE